MTERADSLLRWSPRVLGLAVCTFLGLFALDAFGGGTPASEAIPDFLVHVAPAAALAGVVALSWRWEWLGGAVFTGLAVAYAVLARMHPAWIPPISGPLLVVGGLFLWNWARSRRARRPA